MKALLSETRRFFAEIWSDAMLAAMIFAPVLIGALFRFGVPALDRLLCGRLDRAVLLAPYYPLFDLVLCLMTPMMFTFAGVMVILGEADGGLAKALSVTPAGKNGYLLSRVGIPALLSAVYCILIMAGFRLSALSAGRIVTLSLLSGVFGLAVALMVVSFAKNKVEGLALTKLSGLALLGLPAALLVPVPAQYVTGILPSLWMTKLAMGGSLLWALPALFTGVLWTALFWRRFLRRLLA